MKKIFFISTVSLAAIVMVSCGDDVKRTPGKDYMPDMRMSRAYETYADHSNLADKGINYKPEPVVGTVSRGEELPYHLQNNEEGYAQSAAVTNPLPDLTELEMTETDRLYQINCAICHGAKLDGNGPLYKGGAGPYAAKPATLVGDPNIEKLSEGTYFHVMTYGKGVMGSYASQLTRKQRWMVAKYIKAKQAGAATPAAGGTNAADSAAAGGATTATTPSK
ncbi:c-type cytochrome [Aridibaculum aurantiacum]|uniref:c-type cytochrome n=1 Tax=Aridibaculum aurantiacum TaxID=2810307 RepID=UPI001A967DB3|nr:cytochrome c [Aridibaculum aurantiacum]